MRGAIACTFALAACHSNGLEIVVTGSGHVDSVKLFAGVGANAPVVVAPEGVAWNQQMQGTGWQHDPPFLACGTDTPVRCDLPQTFTYEHGSTDTIDLLLALASDDSGSVTGAAVDTHVVVPATGVNRVTLALTPPPSGAAQVWAPDPASGATTQCARFGGTGSGQFVVDLADPDCDGYAEGDPRECVTDVWMGSHGVRKAADATCALEPLGSGACMLGGPLCTDGSGPDPMACAPSAFCVPTSACDVCATSGNALGTSAGLSCLADLPHYNTVNAPFGRVSCQVHASAVPPVTICPGTTTVMLPAASCTSVGVYDPTTGAWGSSLQLAGGAVLTPTNVGCTLTITVSPGTSPTNPDESAGLVAVTLGDGHGIAIPITVGFSNLGCSATNTDVSCAPSLSTSDLGPCLAAPIPPSTRAEQVF